MFHIVHLACGLFAILSIAIYLRQSIQDRIFYSGILKKKKNFKFTNTEGMIYIAYFLRSQFPWKIKTGQNSTDV